MSRAALTVGIIIIVCLGQLAGESLFWNNSASDSSGGQRSSPNQGKQTPETSPTEEDVNSKQPISATGNQFAVAEEQVTGVLQPAVIEQRGYVSSGNLSARTDTKEGTSANLSIDTVHGWKGSIADVNVSDLQRLYIVNGSFSTGIPGTNVNPNGTVEYYPSGWAAISNSTDTGQTQVASYDSSGTRFVSVENQGTKIGTSGKKYDHFAGTSIIWTQSVTNIPRATQFILRFRYLYLRGPLGSLVPGDCSIVLFLNNTRVWNRSLPDVSQRGIWYDTGQILIDRPSIGNVFDFKIGLIIDSTMSLNADSDYNSDGYPDGIVNTVYITAYLDDVSFVGASPPAFDAVNLQFKAGSTTVPVTGASGSGSASIPNPSFWTSSPVTASLQSNTSVSFHYVSRLLSHHFGNSSWTTQTTDTGVSYDAHLGSSSDLRMFTYVGSLGGYEQLSLRVLIPKDWANVTVYDPFFVDVTAQCSISTGLVTVPESTLSRLGWWQLTFQAPNYARSITIQKYSSGTGSWVNSTNFRPGNTTRGLVAIGRGTSYPAILTDVNATWGLPSGTSWSSEKLGPSTNGTIKTGSHVVDASAAGEWRLAVFWTNGTELAYAHSYFAVYHRSGLLPVYSQIETEDGTVTANALRYTDLDTSEYVMDGSATIVGNWSVTGVTFLPNLAKKWWEADFDTSLVKPGLHTVKADASKAYLDNVSCAFVVKSYVKTRLTSPNAPWTSCGWNVLSNLTFLFEGYNHTTALWMPITNSSGDTRVYVNWSAGAWAAEEAGISGVYTVLIDTGTLPSGNWLVNVTVLKSNHQTGVIWLTLIVSPSAGSLETLGAAAAEVDIDEVYPLKVRYTDQGGFPVSSANVTAQGIPTSEGLSISQVQEVLGEPGNYSLTVTAMNPGAYSLRIVASAENLQSATAVFVVVVRDIATDVNVLSGDSASVGLTDTFTAVFRYELWNGSGIESAQIDIVMSPLTGLSYGAWQELGGGNYSVLFDPSSSGTYLVTIAASKPFYRTSSDSFFLIVGDISSELVLVNGTSGVIEIGESYRLVVRYRNTTGYGLVGATVHIDSFAPESGLDVMPTEPLENGYYSIILHPTLAVVFVILVRANISNHQVKFATFTLNCMKIASVLLFDNATTTIPIRSNFTLFMHFQTEDLQNLPNATIVVVNAPVGLQFDTARDLGNGHYSLRITPLAMGTYDIVVRASLENYLNASAAYTLSVSAIPMSVQLLSELGATEGIPFEVSVRVYETGSDIPISGVEVTFRITATHAGDFYPMTETSSAGTYSSNYTIPTWQEYTTYYFEVKANKDNYTLSSTFSVPFHKTNDLMIRMGPLIFGSGSGAFLLLAGLIGLRVSRRRKRTRNIEALSVKRRFDDVSNMLGIIVMQKKSGVPLYSRVFRGGFDESMVSAFIAAITSFRTEFGMDEKHMDFQAVPISDIISAVPTKNLICAFVTVSAPSATQQMRMEEYGRAAGAMFDDVFAYPQSRVLGPDTLRMFDSLFNDLMDGSLLEAYKTSAEASIPRNMKCLQSAASHMLSSEGFRLDELAKGMTLCGVEEATAYKMIIDAIGKDLLVRATESGRDIASS